MPSRARDKQLAKLAARRQAERSRRKRRRDITLGAIVGRRGARVGRAWASAILLGGDGDSRGTTPDATATGSPTARGPGPRPARWTRSRRRPRSPCGAKVPPGAGKPKPQFAGPPPMTIDPKKTYTATMVTSCGTIAIELDPEPRTPDREQLRVPRPQGVLRRAVLHAARHVAST